MAKNLVIVESPAKAKTIEKFLGKEYTVKSSFGHIRDLVKKDFGVDVNNNFKPHYEVIQDKKKLVTELRAAVKKADSILLASDEDREGEAIAWHLYEVLKLKNKDTKRIVFNEITKNAIKNAVANPGSLNFDLVNAQQARRILDRLVGFELSSVLWKKVKSSLSAGRVQSVAVRLLVEREREIINFKSSFAYKVIAIFDVKDKDGKSYKLEAELTKTLKTEQEVKDFFEKIKNSEHSIADIEKKPAKRSPAAPFTTSSLQQEASRKLGFPVSKTMRVAQRLYESGKITYMRTDSVNLSQTALKALKEEILEKYGDKYYNKRTYKTKTKGAQEAHEAIRPTYVNNETVSGSYDEIRLYDLIRKRTLASQMSNAQFEKTIITVKISNAEETYSATGEVLIFDGFLKAYSDSTGNKSTFLPPVDKGQSLYPREIKASQRFTKYPPRYTEAALVRRMEELGIGRPSTYAPTITTIQNRGYVVKESREGNIRKITQITLQKKKITTNQKEETFGIEKGKLFPTDIGIVVTDFLIDNFNNIVDYNFTANVEKEFDDIAQGQIVWHEMISKFYHNFHARVEDTIEHAERNAGERVLGVDKETGKQVTVRIGKYGPLVQLGEKTETEKPKFASLNKDQHLETITLDEALELLNSSATGRLIGKDPTTGKNLYARFARYGAVIQLGENDDKEKPKYASLLKGMTIDNITLEQAVELFKLPRDVGKFEDKKIVAAIGRFGPYVRHDSKFVSLKKDDDPLKITEERAIQLIKEKREKDKARIIKEFPENKDISIIYDRWKRPCIFYNKKYTNISKIKEPEKLSLEDCLKLVENTGTKKTKTKSKAKKSTRKATKKK